MKFGESARGCHWRSVVLPRLTRTTDSPATVSSFMRSKEAHYIVRYRPQSEWLDELGRLKAACKIWSFRFSSVYIRVHPWLEEFLGTWSPKRVGHGWTRMKTRQVRVSSTGRARGKRSPVPGGPVGIRPRGQYPDRRSGESHGFPAQIR